MRVLRYLKLTSTYGLLFDGKNNSINYELFTDASFASSEEARHSVTGWLSKMAGCCISWRSIAQKSVATSTMESEIIAVSEGVKESYGFF